MLSYYLNLNLYEIDKLNLDTLNLDTLNLHVTAIQINATCLPGSVAISMMSK